MDPKTSNRRVVYEKVSVSIRVLYTRLAARTCSKPLAISPKDTMGTILWTALDALFNTSAKIIDQRDGCTHSHNLAVALYLRHHFIGLNFCQ